MRKIIFCLFIICVTGLAAQNQPLKAQDVHKVMNEIFQQHVDQTKMTADIMNKAFKVYIDQFDRDRLYLLDAEVEKFTKLSPYDSKRLLMDYQQDKLSKFQELDRVIQSSIKRSRAIRQDLMANQMTLFHESSLDPKAIDLIDDDEKRPFAKNITELKERIQEDMVEFISGDRQRYGDQVVMRNKQRTLEAYFDEQLYHENQYLYVDDQGRPLSKTEEENLFVMHVLKALARSLDSHTTYLDPNEAHDMKIRLEKGFKGIGVVLVRKPEGIAINRLITGGPAEKSGVIESGDVIIKINGEDVTRDTLEELVDKLREHSEGSLYLVLKRGQKLINVTLNPELISVDEGRVDIETENFKDGLIATLKLGSFYQGDNGITSEKDLRQAIKKLEQEGNLRGLVLDLRENSGGFLNQAVKVAGLFITNGVVVISKYNNGKEKLYRDMDGKVSFDGPIIVLTSKATASAAEIVAQALQDYGVALIVGDEQTYGKGTIQSQTVTDDHSSSFFKVTVGKYYTVSGKTPQMEGVKADIVVPSYYANEMIGEEYLEYPIGTDKIQPFFDDQLADVEPGLKPWYMRYYMPTLQKRQTAWNPMIPWLKDKSSKRLDQDSDYKKFISGEMDWRPFDEDFNKISSEHDFQHREAINILKDMIAIEDAQFQGKVANQN